MSTRSKVTQAEHTRTVAYISKRIATSASGTLPRSSARSSHTSRTVTKELSAKTASSGPFYSSTRPFFKRISSNGPEQSMNAPRDILSSFFETTYV